MIILSCKIGHEASSSKDEFVAFIPAMTWAVIQILSREEAGTCQSLSFKLERALPALFHFRFCDRLTGTESAASNKHMTDTCC